MKRVLIIFLCLITCFSAVSCADNQSSTPKDNGVSIVNPFDTQKQLSSLQLRGYLGKAELNTDKEYVKGGDGSMKVTVTANPVGVGTAHLFQGMNQTSIGREDYSDFGKVSDVVVDVYSAQEEVTKVGFKLIYFYDSWGDSKQSIVTWFELKQGWNKITYSPGREYIPYNGESIKYVELISIQFERGAQDRVYYFDEMKLYKTELPANSVVDLRSQNEICSFDQVWQMVYLKNFSWVKENLQPQLEYNTNPAFTATGTGGSLKMTFPKNTVDNAEWPGILIDEELLGTKDFTIYDDNDYLAVDLYTPQDKAVSDVTIMMFGKNFNQNFMTRIAELTPGKWNTVRISVKDMNENSYDEACLANFLSMEIVATSRTYETQLYVDNIRMVVVD